MYQINLQNPFANKNININNQILALMKNNPQLRYIKGYENIYYNKNQIKEEEKKNNAINFLQISEQINNNQININQNIPNNSNKFIEIKNNVVPQIFNSKISPNMNLGAGEPFFNNNNINQGNFQNFTKYVNDNKIDNISGVPKQFQDNNSQNNFQIPKQFQENNSQNNMININSIPPNINGQLGNNMININNIPKNYNNNNSFIIINPEPQININDNQSNTNIKNPIFNLDIQNNQKDKKKLELFTEALAQTSNNIIPNTLEINNKITIKFIFRDNNDPIELSNIDPNKKFSEILSNFLNAENIPNLDPQSVTAIHNCNIVNKDRTLNENYIKNEDKILLYSLSKQKKNSNLEEDDKEIISRFLDEYKANKLCVYLIELEYSKNPANEIPKFDINKDTDELISFLLYRARKSNPGINILEHEHQLVCCLTNYNWKCNLCNKTYTCNEEKFCCTVCDYYLCQKCRKLKDYERRKTIKKDITPDNGIYREKYLKTNYHKEHKLIYCITSRNYFGETFWNCDICGKKYNNWGFYCSICEFDLCNDCRLKEKNK